MSEDEARRVLGGSKTQLDYLDRLRAVRRLDPVTSEEEREAVRKWNLQLKESR
jgi:hypothetical protein